MTYMYTASNFWYVNDKVNTDAYWMVDIDTFVQFFRQFIDGVKIEYYQGSPEYKWLDYCRTWEYAVGG